MAATTIERSTQLMYAKARRVLSKKAKLVVTKGKRRRSTKVSKKSKRGKKGVKGKKSGKGKKSKKAKMSRRSKKARYTLRSAGPCKCEVCQCDPCTCGSHVAK